MKWSWKIGRVMGIDLRLHATFLSIFSLCTALSLGACTSC